MDTADDREALARHAWRLLMGAGQRHLETVTAGIEEMGLSKVMAQFLGAVCQSPPGPTNQLATRFGVDPGWVTDIVDRLEARGELVRRPSAKDRRVKILEVTDSGRETFSSMEALFATPPLSSSRRRARTCWPWFALPSDWPGRSRSPTRSRRSGYSWLHEQPTRCEQRP